MLQLGVTSFIFWIFNTMLLTQCANLPQNNTKCPYIAFTGIEVLTHGLYWQPPQWNFLVLSVNIYSRPWQTKVWYLQYLALVNEDVTSCQVPEMYVAGIICCFIFFHRLLNKQNLHVVFCGTADCKWGANFRGHTASIFTSDFIVLIFRFKVPWRWKLYISPKWWYPPTALCNVLS